MRVLVVGSGAREHAFCHALRRDLGPSAVLCAPGNAGIARTAACLPVDPADPAEVEALIRRERVDFTVVGPELPLTRGLVDRLTAAGHPVCGPTRAAAEIESSKAFAKRLLAEHGIPTARHLTARSADEALACLRDGGFGYPVVLKADGLAAGKGVIIAGTEAEARDTIRDIMVGHRFGDAGSRVVIEEFMTGREASFFVLTDGIHARVLPSAEDHKRAYDGEAGPNTGGMGAFSPSPLVDEAMGDRILDTIVFPTLRAMAREGRHYRGFLYCGLMLTDQGPRVVEFNARMGDPETQVVLPAIDEPLLPHLEAAAQGALDSGTFRVRADRFVGVVLASGGYPGTYETGKPITGLEAAEASGALVFHAGTAARDGAIVTAGGRVLTVVAGAPGFAEARARAYAAARKIAFEGMFCRQDIGVRVGQ